MLIPVASIKSQRFDRERDPAAVMEMAKSLMTVQLQPIRVLPITNGEPLVYRVIDGGTRLAAARFLGWEFIDCVVAEADLTPTDELVQCYTANKKRTGWTVLQEAEMFTTMMKENNWTPAELARQLDIAPSEVTKVLAISKDLVVPLKNLVAEMKLAPSSAYLLSRGSVEAQMAIVDKAASMTRQEIEVYIGQQGGGKKKTVVKTNSVKIGCVTVTFPADMPDAQINAFLATVAAAVKAAEKAGLPASQFSLFLPKQK